MPYVHSEQHDGRVKPCARQMARFRVSECVRSVQYVFEHYMFSTTDLNRDQAEPIFIATTSSEGALD